MATNPGIHPSVDTTEFEFDERRTVGALSQCFYITNARTIRPARTEYRFLLMRPAENIAHAIPNAREIVFLFSPYDNFEARTLDAYYHIEQQFESHRINTHFRMLCSMDSNIKGKMQKLCVDEPDLPVTIPFLYNQISSFNALDMIVKAARENYYFRDLFAQKSPLQNDTYFFGRGDFLAKLRDRMARAENSGVFGLRKSGKTSILLAAMRAAKADGHRFLLVDCQSPTTQVGGWNDLLRIIIQGLRKAAGLSVTNAAIGDFTLGAAADSFEKHMAEIYSSGKRISVIALDEVEHISPGSGAPAWQSGENALFFWQTIRSVQQRYPGRLSFIVAGTNPKITESRRLAGADNPLLEYIHVDYLGGLRDRDLQKMCREIGNLMGMDMDLEAVSLLYSVLGGHPYLTRQVCSQVHQNLRTEGRPCRIRVSDVQKVLSIFDFNPLLDDVMGSLSERYPDEYTCLEWIALGDTEQVDYFLTHDPAFVRHLVGYGIIDMQDGVICPRLELALDYIRKKSKQSALVKNPEDRWGYIAAKRGSLEIRLREILRGRLLENFCRANAVAELSQWITKKRGMEISMLSFDELFSRTDCKLYFADIVQSVRGDRAWWSRRMGMGDSDLLIKMDLINTLRNDAHAKIISDNAFDELVTTIETLLEAA